MNGDSDSQNVFSQKSSILPTIPYLSPGFHSDRSLTILPFICAKYKYNGILNIASIIIHVSH